MTAAERERADALLEEELLRSSARDPREYYRERLRELKERDRGAYDEAARYFEETLIPSIASERVAPLVGWTEYGRKLAELAAPGRTVMIDASGRARPYSSPPAPADLVLHLPQAPAMRALLVGLPAALSDAQRATYEWLVLGRQKLRGVDEAMP
jgi:hypothetical protein